MGAYMLNRFTWDVMSTSRSLSRPWTSEMPVVMAVGDQAPDAMCVDCALRLQKALGVDTMHYIPSSKGLWVYEGMKQQSKVASLLGELLQTVFKLHPLEHKVTASAPLEASQATKSKPPQKARGSLSCFALP